MFAILVGILGAYAGVQFVGTEIDYRAMSSEAQRVAAAAGETPDAGLQAQIRTKATELGLPQSASAATIRRLPNNRITITLQYPDSLTFFGQWHWVWNRRIQIDQTYNRY